MQYLIPSETVARLSVFWLFALVPFFFIPISWVSIAQSKMFLLGVLVVAGVVAWTSTSLREGTFKVPKSPLLLAGVFLPIAYLISAVGTGFSWESFIGNGTQQDTVVVVVMWFTLFLVSANVLAARHERILYALRALLCGGSVLLLIQIAHLLFPSFTFGGVLIGSATSAFGSWHDLGIFLGLVLFVSLAALSTSVAEGIWWRVALGGLAVLSGAFLLIVNFRDVWLGLCAIALLYTFFLWRFSRSADEPNRARARSRVLWWILIVAILLGLYWGGVFINQMLPERLRVVQFEVRPSWQGTYAIGQRAFAEPGGVFLGSGPNSFPREWGLHKPIEVNATQFWNVDFYSGVGFIPTSFVTIGFLGLIAWGAVALALLFSLYKVLFKNSFFSENTLVRGIIVVGALYLTAYHGMYTPGHALSALVFLFFGALVASELLAGSIRDLSLPTSFSNWRGIISAAALCIVSLLVLLGGVQLVRALVSDSLVNRAVVVYEGEQDLGEASRSISWALGILPHNDRAHRAGVEIGILQLSQLAEAADADSRAQLQATLTTTIQHGLAAVSIESRNYQNWLTLARLYGELAGVGVEGAEQNARAAYAEARKNNPTSPLPNLGEAQLDLAKRDEVSARKNLEAALGIKPDLPAAHFLLSQIDARAGKLKEAREHAALVAQLVQQDSLGWYNLGTILYAEKNYKDAALSLERAVGLTNNYANALFLLGLSYEKLDRKDDALKTLKAVLVLNPANAAVSEMIARIEANEDIDFSAE